MLGFIVLAILVITSVAAWLNTKIIIEEIESIKKYIGMPEYKPPIVFENPELNYHDGYDKKQE